MGISGLPRQPAWVGSTARPGTFTRADGLGSNKIGSILQDRNGIIWVGTDGGVSRYNGESFESFTAVDRPGRRTVVSIVEDKKGDLWFGTRSGVFRYDGKQIQTYFTEDGLASNRVWFQYEDRDGDMWVGTTDGVSRFDGNSWETFTMEDGLAGNVIRTITQDSFGHMWFGTQGGGVSRFDGQVFQNLIDKDGLPSNNVVTMTADRQGHIWIGTNRGLLRYIHPEPDPTPVTVQSVVTDRRYLDVAEVETSTSIPIVAFEFSAISFKTRPEALFYRYRLKGHEDWGTTFSGRVEYEGLGLGTYEFEVEAVNRDLVYSDQPAVVKLTVHPPYRTIGLTGGLIVAVVALVFVSGYAVKRKRDLFAEMEKELQSAHDMQMGLMAKSLPRIEGVDVAGRCIPANHVGGDFYQFFEEDGKLILAMADVTGHAMEAAIPVVMFSGILKSQMEQPGSLDVRFERLNRSLYGTLSNRTFIACVMGEFNLLDGLLTVADSGCPYPYHYRASEGKLEELEVNAFPFGVGPDTHYGTLESELHSGDCVVFCSDGIIEMENVSGSRLGFKGTEDRVQRACEAGLSASGTLERILDSVGEFQGVAPQKDDVTCVVVKIE